MACDFVIEERIESMVSPTGGKVCRRTAHFLKPSVASIDGSAAAPSLDSLSLSADAVEKYSDLPLKANFVGWKRPTEEWKEWVENMSSSHRSTWESAGILEAIMSSTITIHRNRDLIFGFLEKWCPSTNSFAFRWGEATMTLEDMAVLGGYSVLGESVLSPQGNEEMQKIVRTLGSHRSSLAQKTKSKRPGQKPWMDKFMDSRRDIEHEAFLAYWLSRFVFPSGPDIADKKVLSIAARLARGTRIALAPAVLASIYKSLTSLKAGVIAARKSGANEGHGGDPVEVTVLAPLGLVQVWIWERFPSLRPKPKPVGLNEPRLARWDNLKTLGIGNMKVLMDSPATVFLWRPYTSEIKNDFPGRIYKDGGYWALIDSDLDEDMEGFIRCVRTCELVGVDADCIEQYLPHRVALQFGMDQDIPGHVARVNVNPRVAWSDYTRPVRDTQMYIPSRLFEPQYTSRYSNWWKKLYQGCHVELRIGGKVTSKGSNGEKIKIEVGMKLEKDDLPPPPSPPPPPGFSQKMKRVAVPGKSDSSVAQEVSPRQSPLSSPCAGSAAKNLSCGKSNSSKSLKRKLLDSSYGNSKISDYYAPASPSGSALKRSHFKGSNSGTAETKETVAAQSSVGRHHENYEYPGSTGHRVNADVTVVEPAKFKAEDTEQKEDSRAMDVENAKKMIDSLNQVQSSTFLAPEWIQQLTDRIEILEKLAAWLKKGRGTDRQ